MQGRALVAAILLSLAGGSLLAQSLGETAEQEKERRAKAKKPAKVYTNDDLSKPEDSKDGKQAEGKDAKAKPAATPAPTADAEHSRAEADAASKAHAAEEASWRQRASIQRARVQRAEQRIPVIQARIDALMTDMNPNPTDAFDPNRLQKIEAQKAQAIEELEKAKAELAEARKALEDLEDQARAKSIPPGWLREP